MIRLFRRYLAQRRLAKAAKALRQAGYDKERALRLAMLNTLRKEQGMEPFVPGHVR